MEQMKTTDENTPSFLEGGILREANSLLNRVAHPSADRITDLNNALEILKAFKLPLDIRTQFYKPVANVMDGSHPVDVSIVVFKRHFKVAALWATILFGFPVLVGPIAAGSDSLPGIVAYSLLAWPIVWIALSVIFAPIFAPVMIADCKRTLIDTRCRAADVLGAWAAPASLEPLAMTAQDKNPALRSSAQKALTRTLSTATSELYGFVPASAQLRLAALLSHRHAPGELKLRVLEGLGHFGGGVVLREVRKVGGRDDTEGLGEAARSILPILEERFNIEKNASLLVRATDRQDESHEMLLHSVGSSGSTNDSTCLRPATSPIGAASDCWQDNPVGPLS